MIQILIVTHGPLAEALKVSAGMFFPQASDITALSLNPQDNPLELKDRIVAEVRKVNEGDGVLIFADLFAGTPCNMTALALTELPDIPILCLVGVNLPLVMEALGSLNSMDLHALTAHLTQIAADTILDLRAKLEL